MNVILNKNVDMRSVEAAKELARRYLDLNAKALSYIHTRFKKTVRYYSGTMHGGTLLRELTGFGSVKHCAVCSSIDHNCKKCLYNINDLYEEYGPGDCVCTKEETYKDLENAYGEVGLEYALHERAKYILNLVARYEKAKNPDQLELFDEKSV